ncbi:MAG: glucose-1-phosphate adenylyltransferase [Bacillus sp. (in: Bacteria)]|nr:glucose-1-phosphate adenylyltransferase [Bacillus sp. (in: firmicutes)]
MLNKKCIAMLLAGGRGTRLKKLTEELAKPAVPFGGKYRIVDFTLSNCRNSGIDTVGVLTQYQPHVLQNYIKDGKDWDLDSRDGGLSILPPYQCGTEERWYDGTAHAIYQNISYIDQYNPDYVLVISGDHIYKMDYNLMLQQHIKTGADATISVTEVPWAEASRFGIMNTDSTNNRIVDFEEKPSNPKSNLASMGVYIFKWKTLKNYLQKEEKNELSSKDFGKDIIPAMLTDNRKLHAYTFKGYWKDVGTIDSFWEANMDLLSRESNIFLNDKDWTVFTHEQCFAPSYIESSATVKRSIISEGCEIYGTVENSVIFNDVIIGKGAIVKDSVLLPGTVIGENVVIEKSVTACNVTVEDHSIIAPEDADSEIVLIGESVENKQTRVGLSRVI